MFILKVPDGLW